MRKTELWSVAFSLTVLLLNFQAYDKPLPLKQRVIVPECPKIKRMVEMASSTEDSDEDSESLDEEEDMT